MNLEDFFNDPMQLLAPYIPEHFALDVDGDSLADIELRAVGDSLIPNQVLLNVDGHPSADLVVELHQGPHALPSVAVKADLDGGGFDLALADINGDWWPDFAAIDSNGDGTFSKPLPTSLVGVGANLVGGQSGLDAWAEVDEQMSVLPPDGHDQVGLEYGAAASFDPLATVAAAEPILGMSHEMAIDPEANVPWEDHWHLQESPTTCAVCCQEFILEEVLGREFSESELASIGQELGVYGPLGTHPADIGAILRHFGIESDIKFHAEFDDLSAAVRAGHGVIVGVDADEIWDVQEWSDARGIPLACANHAVQVAGIEGEGSEALIVLNDPGHPGGRGLRVPASKFLDAWHDSERAMCVTRKAVLA